MRRKVGKWIGGLHLNQVLGRLLFPGQSGRKRQKRERDMRCEKTPKISQERPELDTLRALSK